MPKLKRLTKKRVNKRKRNTRRIVGGAAKAQYSKDDERIIKEFIDEVTIDDVFTKLSDGTFNDTDYSSKIATSASAALLSIQKITDDEEKKRIRSLLDSIEINKFDAYPIIKEVLEKQIPQLKGALEPVDEEIDKGLVSNLPPPSAELAQPVNEDNEALYLQNIYKNGKKKNIRACRSSRR